MLICVTPIDETSLRHSGIPRTVKGFHSFTCTPCVSSASGMSHMCLCLPSRSWYSFTDPGGMKGWVDLSAKYPWPRFKPAISRLQIRHSTTQPLATVPRISMTMVNLNFPYFMVYEYNIFMTCASWCAEFTGDKNGKRAQYVTYLVLARRSSVVFCVIS